MLGTTLFFRLGAHKSPTIQQQKMGPYLFLYKEHFGPYHKINDVISEVENWAVKNNLDCQLTFGEYLDNPRTVDERRLRSYGGCILPPMTDTSALQNTPYTYKQISEQDFVVAKFTGAPSLGPLKVYPKVEEYMRLNKIPMKNSVIEIYNIIDDRSSTTTYLF